MRKILVSGLSILVVLAVIFFVFTTAGFAKAGDTLYPFQSGAEQVRLHLTLIPAARSAYAQHLYLNKIMDLEGSSGPIDRKVTAADQALDVLLGTLPGKLVNVPQQEALRRFYEIADKSIQTCCIGSDSDELQLLRKKWKGFDLLIDLSSKQTVDWKILSGEELSPAARALLAGKNTGEVASGEFTHAWFPLTGMHQVLGCDSCHNEQGTVKGIVCSACHTGTQPTIHFPMECSTCHTTAGWQGAQFDHALASGQLCATCHGGDQPDNHYGLDCSSCHTPGSWAGASFNHPAELVANCLNCHSPRAGHFSINCATCHQPGSWNQVSINHGVLKTCTDCHNRPGNHVGGQCSACHAYPSWNRGHPWFQVNHNGAGGKCATCHPGGNAYVTDCQTCHNANGEDGHDD